MRTATPPEAAARLCAIRCQAIAKGLARVARRSPNVGERIKLRNAALDCGRRADEFNIIAARHDLSNA